MRTIVIGLLSLTLATVVVAPSSLAADVQVDPALHAYQPVSGVSGNLNSIGSDTLNNLMTLWAEGFRKYYPSVNIQVEGKGSATATGFDPGHGTIGSDVARDEEGRGRGV